jgi:hypothetical protein
MKFFQRFAYYFVGLIMGLFFVSMVFSGKDTRCNYFPNARVLNDLRNKPFNYSPKATAILAQPWIDTTDIVYNLETLTLIKVILLLVKEKNILSKARQLRIKKLH